MALKFDGPITVHEAVRRIQQDRYLLPGIQRSFVWKRDQITALWDSLLRGYPIGSILVWRTKPANSRDLGFRHFVTDAKGLAPDKGIANPSTSIVETVLDGQQRLTALNIGLRGSFATNAAGSPQRYLWIDLERVNPDVGSERNMYEFAFMSDMEAFYETQGRWFPLWNAYTIKTDAQIKAALAGFGYPTRGQTIRTLRRLVDIIHHEATIPVAIEASRDLDRVLNVFARTNNGGTKLTYVDLLISTATARWTHRSARDEIIDLENRVFVSSGFRFSADRFVKAGLLIVDPREPKLDVETILRGGTERKLENHWPAIADAIEVAARTLRKFGLSERTLTAENVMIPVAYYAWHRGLKLTYASAAKHARDRRLLLAFVSRTLLQRGYWTGAIDPVLTTSRRIIEKHGADGFPLAQLTRALDANPAKSISVDGDLVDELATLTYGDRRTLLLLQMLFPEFAEEDRLDKDHVFPISKFTQGHLRAAGVSVSKTDDWSAWANQLPNLQLLDRIDNIDKSQRLPKDWLARLDYSTRRKYTQQDLKWLPQSLAAFESFWDARYAKLRPRIASLLGLSSST